MAGAPKKIESPEKLYQYFQQYEKYRKSNPKLENVYNVKLDLQASIQREIPLTWDSFEIWLRKNGIIAKLDDYKANTNNAYQEFSYIIHTIDMEIKDDKMSGAIAGIYQHNIIARDLGLIDKSESNVKVKVDPYTELTDEQLKAEIERLSNK